MIHNERACVRLLSFLGWEDLMMVEMDMDIVVRSDWVKLDWMGWNRTEQ